ncbi:RNA polymerase sigma factor [Cellulophaga lytica]|uniref:RNA polymerase sigma factor n=1 Tax=Cellulophaga lytica (strain ATCC 23178 / DSM 7489 / JCM 8516 / NBRC 14961 / NCIMB 1423 / VKM B-1433 / Cy l20) TaxID=867900 RepID=F0RA03_CELLC|nr:sigma-70 family RNA polymerase sigma factor [Cellulophaga lytica]ADY28332.1 RNA polymerase, sigma-24 subunit, ECF subfamily [Cellulophaga lytica DSM 7489]WQG77488.1 sigma-70 family RNA polymerase sigma factor [Cellulophaga lytica]
MVTSLSKKYFLATLVTKPINRSSNLQMTNANDQYYIAKVLNGDPQAYTFLVNKYKDMVFTLAVRMLRNNEEAEEVAQDAFVKAYAKLNKFKGDSKFSTWLYKVVYNTSLDKLKKLKKDALVVPIENVTERSLHTIDNALEQMQNKERTVAIQQCIALLSADERALLTLFYFDEMSLKEIAKITATSVNNLKVKLFRSRKKLAAIIEAKVAPEIINI